MLLTEWYRFMYREGFDLADYSMIPKLLSNIVPTILVTLGYAVNDPRLKIKVPKEEIFF